MTTPRTDPKGPKPTVSQAKAAWEAHADPGLDNVLQALHDAGFTGTVRSTLYRWHKNGWPDHQNVGRRASPPEDAPKVKKVTEKVADDEAVAEVKAIEAAAAEIKVLRDMAPAPTTLDEIKRIDVLIAEIMLARRIQMHPDYLVKFTARDVGEMLKSLKASPSNVTVLMPGAEQPAEPKTVNGTLIEHDAGERPMTPLQQSIREFRSQQLKVVK